MSDVGYSGTPLARKLGLKSGQRLLLRDAPPGYLDGTLVPRPEDLHIVDHPSAEVDIAHAFLVEATELAALLKAWREQLRADAALWISWPKKASKVPTTITEDRIRELALPLGWVDVKVCAVDATWSGLKLVVRQALR